MTKNERKWLALFPVPDGVIGYDCDGNHVREGDIVEVVEEFELRKGQSRWDFCGVGKRGRAIRDTQFPIAWFIMVEFIGHDTVSCVDYQTRIVRPADTSVK